MAHQENTFIGLNDTEIYYQSWLPEDQLDAILIIVHGFGEHSGRYSNAVDTLLPVHIGIYALDHRGHGKSKGKENHVNRFSDYLMDINKLEQIVRENHPDLPLFMLGHSMGSLIATHYMGEMADQNNYTAFILSGTGSRNGPGINKFTILLAKLLSKITPKLSIPSNLDPNFISHDQQVIDNYVNDPLVHYDKISARLAAEMMGAATSMEEAARNINRPTLIQVGSEDDAFSGEQELYDAINTENKKLEVYDGFRHEVYNEVQKEVSLTDLKDWILSFI